MVGVEGLEPPTPWSQTTYATKLRYTPSPNNSILIASAPHERSGSASGMLATARLIGQTTGAALMALLFHIVPDDSTHTALLLAGGFALTGAVVSLTRIRLPLPEGLARHKR